MRGPGEENRDRRHSLLTVVGLALLAAGLGCLGWVGYQLYGSNLVSERSYERELTQLRSDWSEPSPAPSSGAPATPDAAVRPGAAIAMLRIPSFGSRYEVPILSGTEKSALAKGVGHYSATALPGQVGNFAIAGHRVTHGEPFARLLELRVGDEVVVETSTAVFTYVVDLAPKDLTVKADASWVLDPVPGEPKAHPTRALLTLTTCQDLFRSPDRSVGFAHLASTKKKG